MVNKLQGRDNSKGIIVSKQLGILGWLKLSDDTKGNNLSSPKQLGYLGGFKLSQAFHNSCYICQSLFQGKLME